MTDQQKILVLVGVLPIIGDMLEDCRIEYPRIINYGLKKAVNDFIRESGKLTDSIFLGLEGEQKLEIADQLQNISNSFLQWASGEIKDENLNET